ncbi:MAG TPA: glycerate kinase [Acidobacteriota bacterium]|nr:glycerate kinase [Acidobacteriota bacterium]
MKIVVAPDSFKGSLSAVDAAAAIARGARAVFPEAEVVELPIADGGEGTVAALVRATEGRIETTTVRGPLGAPVEARWGILGDGRTAVIEMAAASGLPLVPPARRDPRLATTRGTGELLRAALDAGLRRIVMGIGGSATNDGGAGMARALGARFLDGAGAELADGGAALARLGRIDLAGLDPRLERTEIVVACDVSNPLTGARGASEVYGPQKGATPEMVAELDAALEHYARAAREATGRDVAEAQGAGAAGGLGAGLLFFTHARLRPGIEVVLEAIDFQGKLEGASLVVTGEGKTDFQTAFGKAPAGVAAAAKRRGLPVICLSGCLGEGAEEVRARGVDALAVVPPRPMPLEECVEQAAPLLEQAAERVFRLVRVGEHLAGH